MTHAPLTIGTMDATFNQRVVCGHHLVAAELAALQTPLILTTPSALLAARKAIGLWRSPTIQIASGKRLEVERILADPEIHTCESIVGLGTGSAIDAAKVIAATLGKQLVAIPTGLSCNAFATNKSVIFGAEGIRTVVSKTPDLVVIDTNLLAISGMRFTIAGVGDVLSIYSALHDWELARLHQRDADNLTIRVVAEALLEPLIEIAPRLCMSDPDAVKQLAQLLLLSGYLTNLYGSGRPESGSEHMFARALEEDNRFGRVLLHGEAVLLGILLVTELQRRPSDEIYRIARIMKLWSLCADGGLREDEIVAFLLKASTIQSDRFSIFNVISLNDRRARRAVQSTLSKL